MRLRVSKNRSRNRTETYAAIPAAIAAGQGLPADAVAEVAGEVGDLVDARGEDDRRREQEREAGRVLVVETAREAGDHRDARPADPREQRADLRDADEAGFLDVQRVGAPADLALAVRGRVRLDEAPDRGPPAEPLAEQQDQAVDGEEDGGGLGLRERASAGCARARGRRCRPGSSRSRAARPCARRPSRCGASATSGRSRR